MLISELPIVMVRCLTITIFIEIIVALIIGVRDKKDLLNIVLVNIVTNPLVVTIPVFFEWKYKLIGRNISLIILELFAFLFEGLIYKKYLKFKKIDGFIISLILNLCSYTAGLIII